MFEEGLDPAKFFALSRAGGDGNRRPNRKKRRRRRKRPVMRAAASSYGKKKVELYLSFNQGLIYLNYDIFFQAMDLLMN